MRDYDSGAGVIGFYVGFLLGAMIIAVSANIWIAILLTLSCLVLTITAHSGFIYDVLSASFFFPLLFLVFILYGSYKEKRHGESWSEAYNKAYRETRLGALEWLVKCFRIIGLSTEVNLQIIKKVVFRDGKLAFFDETGKEKLAKKSYLLPKWKYRSFWYLTGFAPIETEEKVPRNAYILMTYVPTDYGDNIKNHRYFLICPNQASGFEYAILVDSSNIPNGNSYIIAVSLGPIEVAL
jgi:hypothetical protein